MDAKDLVDVLVEQNKTYKEMMQFAITSIITLLVVFLAANFFSMRKMRKDEIENTKLEVTQGIKDTTIPEIESQLNNSLTTLVENKLSALESKVNSFERRVQGLEASQKSQKRELENEITRLQGTVYRLNGELAVFEKVYNNAFNHYLDAGNSFVKASALGRLPGVLSELEKSAVKMDYVQSELSRFMEFSKGLDQIHQHQCEKIIGILKAKRPL